MTERALILSLSLLLAGILQPCRASGSDESKKEAKEHFMKGKALVEEGALKEAIEEFEQSYTLMPVPVVLYNIAICWDELHEYVKALGYYHRYLEEAGDLTEERQAKVQSRLDAIAGKVGTLKIVDAAEGAEVWIDDALVGATPIPDVLLETGKHSIVIKTPDQPEFELSFTISAGEETSVVVKLPEPEEPPPEEVEEVPEETDVVVEEEEEQPEGEVPVVEEGRKKLGKTPFIAVSSIAGAILASSIITGSLAYTTHLEFQSKYREDESEWKPLKDKSDALATTTDVLIGVGAAAAATAVLLAIFTDWKGEKQVQDAGVEEGGTSALVTSPLILQGGAGILVQGTF